MRNEQRRENRTNCARPETTSIFWVGQGNTRTGLVDKRNIVVGMSHFDSDEEASSTNIDNGGPSPSSLRRARLARFGGSGGGIEVGDRVEARVGNCESSCQRRLKKVCAWRRSNRNRTDPGAPHVREPPPPPPPPPRRATSPRQGNGTTQARYPRHMRTVPTTSALMTVIVDLTFL